MKNVFHILIVAFVSQFAWNQESKNVELLDVWNDTSIFLGVEDHRYSDLWAFESNGQDYVAVGTTEGTVVLLVQDEKLIKVAEQAGAFGGYTVVHRDMKTYENYLYSVCDEGTSTLQIFDTQYLPDSLPKVYDSNAFFTICHNIFIDEDKAKLYACGANDLGMKVLDISAPANPTLIHDFNNVNYVHDAYVSNDTAFLNCGAEGLHVYDFSGSMPIQLGVLDFYANQGYNHSGWMSPSREYYSFIDEDIGTKVKLCEISDLATIQIDELFAPSEYENYTPHNVILLDNTAFVSYYNLGFRMFDISQKPIKEIGFYDTFHQETSYTQNGAWGVSLIEDQNQVLIADRQNGIFLFSVPIDILESDVDATVVTSNPFIDADSRILPKEYFDETGLKFSVFALDGSRVYFQESLINWMNIPLTLSAGAYSFGIYNSDGELLESGKFVKAN
ncbi:MAG: hypothetical protein BM555_00070 [Crocinitomix sp. MedPE-SWsnd]|nr:MAG: hypothetical protein BM555_00070 [Crocinitomix sp. MedPE-SWsnd]